MLHGFTCTFLYLYTLIGRGVCLGESCGIPRSNLFTNKLVLLARIGANNKSFSSHPIINLPWLMVSSINMLNS